MNLYRKTGLSMLLIAFTILIAPSVPNTVPYQLHDAFGIHPYVLVVLFATPGVLMWMPRLSALQFGLLLTPLLLYSILAAVSVAMRGTGFFVPAVLYGTLYFALRELASREVNR